LFLYGNESRTILISLFNLERINRILKISKFYVFSKLQ
jgi:hypothetical protein